MADQHSQVESREAAQGEKMIEIKVRFWTDNISPEPDKIIPKSARASGVVRAQRNKAHGVESLSPKPFNSLMELNSVIEDVLLQHGITLHPSRKMQKYIRDK